MQTLCQTSQTHLDRHSPFPIKSTYGCIDITKLSGIIDIPKGQEAIQQDLDLAQEVGQWKPHEVQYGHAQGQNPFLLNFQV